MPKRRRPQLRRRETDEEMAARLQREEDARAGALLADSIHMQLLAAVSSAFGSSAAAVPPPPRVRRRTHSHHHHHHHRSFEESGGEDDDYEWYLEHLEDVKVGLSPAALRSMPSYRFATIATADKATAAAAEAANADADACSRRCAICMCDFEQDEEVRRLPCLDLFHAACVDHWLAEHTTCPVCRCDVRVLLADSAQHQQQQS